MRKIIVGAMVSMDGVMQAPGAATEEFDLLLGRKTYEIFAAYWPYQDEAAPHGDIAKLFKDIKKYAVSRSGEVDTSWAGSVLLRDIADVKRLKTEDPMKTDKDKTYQLKLTPRQQEEIRELTGKEADTLELSITELEERIVPGLGATN